MKAKIKVLVHNVQCCPEILPQGDWIDLSTAEDVVCKAPQAGIQYQKNNEKYRDVEYYKELISLGVSIKLPSGYEAILAPRSSTFKKYGIIQTNSFGVIDETYSGNNDIWKMPVIMTEKNLIPAGTRICQFRIQLSQKATFWQKIKWLFTSGVELEFVENLDDNDRGGFGSTD